MIDLRPLAPRLSDPADAARLRSIVAAVVHRAVRDWPHLRGEVEADVVAALWSSGYTGAELVRRAKGIARNTANETIDLLARPVKLPSVNRRRAEEAVRLMHDEGMSLQDAAEVVGTTPRSLVSMLPALDASYVAADALALLADGGRTSPVPVPASFIDAAERLERAALDALDDVYRDTWYAVSGQDPFEDVERIPAPVDDDEPARSDAARPVCTACFERFARSGSVLCSSCTPRRRPATHPRTQQEAAEQLGVSQSTVSRRLDRIRQAVAAADA